MSRGRRGGRRQRRREEQARQAPHQGSAQKSNGQADAAAVVIPAAPGPGGGPTPPALPAAPEPLPPTPSAPAPKPAHPRPMSARELVARLERLRAHEAEGAQEPAVEAAPAVPDDMPAVAVAEVAAPPAEPRRFHAQGSDWIATHAGRGAGGTGRVAHARLEAIRFASSAEPERVVAEVLAPHARLDDLYDDELAALLAQGLRYRKEDG